MNAPFLPVADIMASPVGNRLAALEQRAAQTVRTLLDTSDAYDAEICGYDGPRDPAEDGEGLRATYDGRYEIPSVILNGPDGQVCLNGLAEIKAFADVLLKAESYARKHGRAACAAAAMAAE